ncbi:hypothetical protein CR51_35920 [Caballeronia megalochromosomata]|nr:hypothetical protein CR51_35920 [Caballeronia megalochromosomata]
MKIPFHRFDGYWIFSDDIEHGTAKGAAFRIYEEDGDGLEKLPSASFELVDVSNDITEPDISTLSQSDISGVDTKLHAAIRDYALSRGAELTEWMTARLNELDDFRGLVAPYILNVDGRPTQFVTLRFTANARKIVVIGSFLIERGNVFAASVFGTLRDITISKPE